MWVLTRIDIAALGRLVAAANWLLIAVSVMSGLAVIWLKCERWRLVLQGTGCQLSSGTAFRLFSIGLLAGLATPGQLGDFAKALSMPRHGGTIRAGLVASVADRVFDLTMLVGMALYYFAAVGRPLGGMLPLSVAILSGWMMALSIGASSMWAICVPVLEKMPGVRSIVDCDVAKPSVSDIVSLSSYTFLAYVIYNLRLYLLLVSLGGRMALPEFVSSMAIMSLAALLPITIAGLGARELAVILLFRQFGLSSELAVGFSLLVLLLYVSNGLVGLAAWCGYWRDGEKQDRFRAS